MNVCVKETQSYNVACMELNLTGQRYRAGDEMERKEKDEILYEQT